MIILMVIGALVLLTAIMLVPMFWAMRVQERRIRVWADQKEYAVIRIRRNMSLLAFVLGVFGFVFLVFALWGLGSWWALDVEDSRGGQRTAHVFFGKPWSLWGGMPWQAMNFQWR